MLTSICVCIYKKSHVDKLFWLSYPFITSLFIIILMVILSFKYKLYLWKIVLGDKLRLGFSKFQLFRFCKYGKFFNSSNHISPSRTEPFPSICPLSLSSLQPVCPINRCLSLSYHHLSIDCQPCHLSITGCCCR